jgi:long-chain fatty acid transport protein
MNFPSSLLRAMSATACAALPVAASASGFQLLEQSAAAQGTAFAGTAATAEDASTVFSNPAGIAYLPREKESFAANLSAVQPSAKFANRASVAPLLQTVGNDNGGDAGSLAWLPSLYFTRPIDSRLSLGIALNVPFGLMTQYSAGWAGRFEGVKSDVRTMNLNPSVCYRVSDRAAIGVGVNYQQLDGEFTSAVNYAGAMVAAGFPGLAAAAGEGTGKLTGSNSTWGYNFGILFDLTPDTRLGVSYRSSMKYHLTGTGEFSRTNNVVVNTILGAPTSSARGGAIYSDIELPDTLTLSTLTHLDDHWDLVSDLAWTGWSKIPDLTFRYENNASIVSSTRENWRDTWRVAVGSTYRYNDNWKARVGLAFDQTPVTDTDRTVRLPDNDRTWLSLGGQYRLNRNAAFDLAYSYLMVSDASINNNGGDATTFKYGRLNGTYANNVNILSLQFSIAF